MVIPRTWIRKVVVLYLIERPQGKWDRVAVLMMIKFSESKHPVFRVTSPLSRGTFNSRDVENCQYTSVPMEIRLKLLFRTLLFSSISAEQSQMCERNAVHVKRTESTVLTGRSDPLFESTSLLMTTPTPSIEIPAQENLLQRCKERVERLSQQNRVIKICTDAWSWQRLMLDSTSWQKTLTSSYNLPRQWRVLSTLYHEMKNQRTWKVGIEGTPKLGPCWKSQPVACKVCMEWKLELNLWTKTILTRGSEFLMDWTSWSQTWSTKSTTTTSRKPLKRRRNYLRWRRKDLHTPAVQRPKQNQADLPLLADLQELYLFVKEYGLILNQELNSIKRTQWQKD